MPNSTGVLWLDEKTVKLCKTYEANRFFYKRFIKRCNVKFKKYKGGENMWTKLATEELYSCDGGRANRDRLRILDWLLDWLQ